MSNEAMAEWLIYGYFIIGAGLVVMRLATGGW